MTLEGVKSVQEFVSVNVLYRENTRQISIKGASIEFKLLMNKTTTLSYYINLVLK